MKVIFEWINNKKIFPIVMILIMAFTLGKYILIQDFKNRSSDHFFLVDKENIDSVEKALREITFQEIRKEKISENEYKITVKCPPDKVRSIKILINNIIKMTTNKNVN